jgi:hypothetical protein
MPRIATASRNGSTVLGRSGRGLETSSSRRGVVRRPALTRPCAPCRHDLHGRDEKIDPGRTRRWICSPSLARAWSFTATMLTTRRRGTSPTLVSAQRLQACCDSEPGRDPSSSSSRGPRYVSMTSTSAAITGIGSPRSSRTTGPPADKAGAPGGSIDGFGAVTALACDDRRRKGGPRQLGGSVLLPMSLPAEASAGVL